jgi:hypothetical protein
MRRAIGGDASLQLRVRGLAGRFGRCCVEKESREE